MGNLKKNLIWSVLVLILALQTIHSTRLTNGSNIIIFAFGGAVGRNITNFTNSTITTNHPFTTLNKTNITDILAGGYYQFINEPPTTPTGLSPDGVTRTSTTINLTITASTDLESDTIYYYWFLDTATNPTTPIGMSTNPYLTYEETASGIDYYWKVIASDNITNSTNSSTATFHVAVPTGPSTGGALGGFLGLLKPKKPFYDLILLLPKRQYVPSEMLEFKVRIINQGEMPDNDTELFFWIEDPNNLTINGTHKTMKEIDVGEVRLDEEILIPSNTTLGRYKLRAKLITVFQEPRNAFENFEVVKEAKRPDYMWVVWILIGVIGFLILMLIVYWERVNNTIKRYMNRRTSYSENISFNR